MRVQCNQCGRMFEVAQSQANRALKCVCKTIFIATPMLEEIKDTGASKSSATSQSLMHNQAPIQDPSAEAEPSLEATVTTIAASEEELNDYISFLKVARKQPESEKAEQPRPIVTTEFSNPAEINTAWEKANSLFDSIPESTPEAISEVPMEPQFEKAPEEAPERITDTQRREPQNIKTNPPASAKNSPKAIYIWAAGGIASIALVSFLSFSVTKNLVVEEEKIDPYLSRLLSQPNKIETKQPEQQPAIEPQAAPHLPTVIAKSDPLEKVETELEESHLYQRFITGEFEDLIRIANQKKMLSHVDRALLFEALAQRAGSDQQRLFKILDDVKSYRSASNNDSNLLRSEAAVRIFLATTEGDLTKPIEFLKSLGRTQPHDPLVFAYLGFGLHRLGRKDLADTAWDQAIAIEPSFFWLLQTRKDLFIKSKEWALAESTATKISEIEGYQVYGYREISKIAALQGKNEKAIDYLRKAAQLSPSSAIYISLAKLLKERDFELSAQTYEKALKLKPTKAEIAEASISLARLLCANGKGDQASTFFRTHLTTNMSKSVIVEKAECEAETGLYARAANSYESALKLDPRDSSMWYRYGNILYKNQKTRASLEAVQTSLKLKESENAHILAARVFMKLQNKKEAQKHIQKVLKLNPDQREATVLMKSLN